MSDEKQRAGPPGTAAGRWIRRWADPEVRDTCAVAAGAILLLVFLISQQTIDLSMGHLAVLVLVATLAFVGGYEWGPPVVLVFVALLQVDMRDHPFGHIRHHPFSVELSDLVICACVLAYMIAHGRYRFLCQDRYRTPPSPNTLFHRQALLRLVVLLPLRGVPPHTTGQQRRGGTTRWIWRVSLGLR